MSFTPLQSAVGALFIHLSTTNLYRENGEIFGYSSILSNLLLKQSIENSSLVLGTVHSAILAQRFLPQFVSSPPTTNLVCQTFDFPQLLGIAGLLVGVGTRLGNGCTSGHMIGGLSRLRFRSLIATLLFSTSAVVTVNVLGLEFNADGGGGGVPSYLRSSDDVVPTGLVLFLLSNAVFVYLVNPRISRAGAPKYQTYLRCWNCYYSSLLFGIGLHVSGMINVTKTIGFLSFLKPSSFDPSLIMIVLFAIVPNIFVWRFVKRPSLKATFDLATSNEISRKFIIGNILFGVGWGFMGICPGPALINGVHHSDVVSWLVMFFVGAFVASRLK